MPASSLRAPSASTRHAGGRDADRSARPAPGPEPPGLRGGRMGLLHRGGKVGTPELGAALRRILRGVDLEVGDADALQV